jgi:hypothetical protein
MRTSIEKWGWLDPNGAPQTETFDTVELALKTMAARTGTDAPLERMQECGFRLARVRVTVETLATLEPIEPTHRAATTAA